MYIVIKGRKQTIKVTFGMGKLGMGNFSQSIKTEGIKSIIGKMMKNKETVLSSLL